MSRIGIGNNIMQPDAKCLSCKYWKRAGHSGDFYTVKESGNCSAGYCKKDFQKRGKRR